MTETNGTATAGDLDQVLKVTDILAANDITEELVRVPEWGGSVRIRAFTKRRQQELRAMATDPKTGQVDPHKLELQLFIHGVIEPQFAPIQATELLDKSAGAVDRVLERIMTISGMTREAVREATKSVQD